MSGPWDNDTAVGQSSQSTTPNQPPQPMPWDNDTAAGAVPSSADQIQSPAKPFMQKAGEYGQSIGVGAVRGGANALDYFVSPTIQDINPNAPTFREKADKYLPEPRNQVAGAAAEGAVSAAPFGPAGALIGGAAAGSTEYLNQVNPDHPVANIAIPAAVAAIVAPGTVRQLLKLGRLGLEGTGLMDRAPLVQAKIDQGISAGTPASTTDSDWWRKIQRSLRETIFGGGSINRAQETEQGQLESAVDKQAQKLFPGDVSKQQAGEDLKQGLTDGVGQVKKLFGNFENSLDQAVNPNTTHIDMYPTVRRLIDDLSTAKGSETFIEGLGVKPLDHIDNMIQDIVKYNQGDTLSLSAVRDMKANVGDKLQESLLNDDANKKALKIMYGALADAQGSAYANTPYATAYQQLKSAEHEMYSSIENFVEPLVKEGITPERIAQRLSGEVKLGGTKLEEAFKILNAGSPALRDEYSSMILRNLGKDRTGEFDANRFFTNWQQITPEAKTALFGNQNGDIPKAYDQLALIAENQARGAKATNFSQTAGTAELLHVMRLAGAVAGGAAGYEGARNINNNGNDEAFGATSGAALGALGMSTIGFGMAGRLMTNPAFVRWLATPTPLNNLPAHLRGLAAIAGEYPELKGDLNQFSTLVPPQPQGQEKGFAEGGFAEWKQKYAPHDSGEDYDLKGAYEAGLTPDKKTGHWPDTFKKPNHPTFSDESKYSKENPDLPKGSWQGEHFFPPAPMADGGIAADPFGQPPQNGNIQGYSEGGHVPANENEFPGSLIDMVTKGNVIPFKSGAAGGHSGVQYDIMTTPQPGKAGYIKNPNTPDATLWTTNDPTTKNQFDLFRANDNKPLTDYGKQELGSKANDVLKNDFWRNLGYTTSTDKPPGFATGGSVNEESILDLIMKHESHGQNVMNYIGDKTHTAQGYYQITNSTWKDFAPKDVLAKYPNAMSAPPEVQREVARIIYEAPNGGIGRWANYNPNLKAALGGSNMASNNNSILGKMPAQEQQAEQQHQEPELQDQNKPLIDSIMGADWIEPTTKLASRAILKGES